MQVRNFLTLGASEAVSKGIAFAGHLYLARVLGAEGYGIVAFAAGVTLYLNRLVDFGMESTGSHRIAAGGSDRGGLASAVLGVRLILLVVTVALAGLGAQWGIDDPDRQVIHLYLLTLIPLAISTRWIHLGLQNSTVIGFWRIVGEAAFFCAAIAWVHSPDDIWVVPLALAAGDSITAGALWAHLWRKGWSLLPRWDRERALPVFRAALPLLGQSLLGLLLYNLDVVMLRALKDAETAGLYAAAYALIAFLGNLCALYGIHLLSAFARESSDAGRQHLFARATAIAWAVSLPVAVGGWFVAPGVLAFGFGDAYNASVLPLEILLFAIPWAAVRNVPWAALINSHRSGVLFRSTLIGALVNFALNAALIPPFGLAGAAWATLLAEPCVAAIMFREARICGFATTNSPALLRPVVASAVMAAVLWTGCVSTVPLQIALGAATYALALGVLGGFRPTPTPAAVTP